MAITQKQTDFIKAYFKMLKIRPVKDNQHFWKILYDRYEKDTVDKLYKTVIERPEKTITQSYMPEIYYLKNQSLNLSLDVSRGYCDLHMKYLHWFIKSLDTPPKRVLDIGCDNGIVTCFYAMLFPGTEVVGIDLSENGINCARQLAEHLRLSNVTFKKTGIIEASDLYPVGHFNLITSVTTIKEVIGSFVTKLITHPDSHVIWSIEDLKIDVGSDAENKCLFSIQKLLNENGKYISFERWFFEDCIWWSDKLKNAGLFIDWEKSETLRFQEVGQNYSFPALIADKTVRKYDSLHSTTDFWLRDEIMDPQKRRVYEGVPAEMMLKRFVNKRFMGGVQCNYPKSSLQVRFEVWTDNEMMFCYENSNSGYRELKILPVQSDDSLKQMLLNLKEYHSQNGYKTFYYKDYHDIEKFNKKNN